MGWPFWQQLLRIEEATMALAYNDVAAILNRHGITTSTVIEEVASRLAASQSRNQIEDYLRTQDIPDEVAVRAAAELEGARYPRLSLAEDERQHLDQAQQKLKEQVFRPEDNRPQHPSAQGRPWWLIPALLALVLLIGFGVWRLWPSIFGNGEAKKVEPAPVTATESEPQPEPQPTERPQLSSNPQQPNYCMTEGDFTDEERLDCIIRLPGGMQTEARILMTHGFRARRMEAANSDNHNNKAANTDSHKKGRKTGTR